MMLISRVMGSGLLLLDQISLTAHTTMQLFSLTAKTTRLTGSSTTNPFSQKTYSLQAGQSQTITSGL